MPKGRMDKTSREAKRLMVQQVLPKIPDWIEKLDKLSNSSEESIALAAVRTGINFTKAVLDDDDSTLDTPEIWDELDKLDGRGKSGASTPVPTAFKDIEHTDPDA